MGRRRKSRNIGFRAFEDTDTEILAWWEAMPAGERSAALRGLIRAAIGERAAAPENEGHALALVQVAEDTAWLRAAMTALPDYLEGLLSRMPASQVTAHNSQAESQARLDQAALDRRRANMKRSASW